MTVRQRALLERKGELQNEEIIKEELVALPTGTISIYFYDLEIRSDVTTLDCFRLQGNGHDRRVIEEESP